MDEKQRKLTVDEIRQIDGKAGISEDQALEIIEGLYQLSLITFDIFKKHESGMALSSN